MLLYSANNLVLAIHDDSQNVAPSLYGSGVQVIPVPRGTKVRAGDSVPAPTLAILIAYAATKRWLTATGGATVGGTPLSTDDMSQAKIAQVKQAFDAGAIASTTFKAADSSFVTVNAAQMTALYNGVVAHVQACYAAEAAAAAAITSGAATTYAHVDALFAGIQ